ncbi:MAG: hypothetical protein WA869_10765 [Alloacidobacterium sp.]|jgi:hypothetical protein
MAAKPTRSIFRRMAPVPGDPDIPDAGIDGVLPTALFGRAFISYADCFAVFEPR